MAPEDKTSTQGQVLKSSTQVQETRGHGSDGHGPPKLDLALAFAERSKMKEGTSGCIDDAVPEMWKNLPVLMVLAACDLFEQRILEGRSPMSWAWRVIDLLGIPNVILFASLDDFHYIAKTVVFQKLHTHLYMYINTIYIQP